MHSRGRTTRPTLRTLLAGLLAAALAVLMASPAALAQPGETASETPVYDPGPLTDGSPAPEPAAKTWILADMDTGEVLAAHEPDTKHAPASTQKLLAGLALVDVLDDPDATHEATYDDMLVDGTKVGLLQKNDYTIDDLFHAMLMSSANDAAHALADAAGGQDEAVALMEDKAEELQLTGTRPRNTSGLDAKGQSTTAADLLRVGRAVLEDEYLTDIVQTTEYDFPGATNPDTDEKLDGYPIQNHTRIVGEVEGGLGLKNGHTNAAGGSFVAVVERDDRRLGAAILGGETMTREAAVDLIEWGFAQSQPEAIDQISFETAAEAAETAAAEAPDAAAEDAGATAQSADMDADLAAESTDVRTWAIVLLAVGLLLGAVAVVLARRLVRSRRGSRAP
ncbi:MAG TPA: serine hydrolase [Candidatus Brevibacterium intestinigallinarum]|nr:serine hydrolase [Candidatus Brevibacterium intestinigallinarum]